MRFLPRPFLRTHRGIPACLGIWDTSNKPVRDRFTNGGTMPLLHRGLLYALGGVFVLSFSANLFAQGGPQTAANDQRNAPVTAAVQANPPASAVAVGEIASAELPDSPGAVRSQDQNAAQPQSTPSEP